MSECKIRARVGDKSIEKNVCRPDFEEVLKPYVEITDIGIDEWVAGYRIAKQQFNNRKITNDQFKKEKQKLRCTRSGKIYKKVGTALFNFFDEDQKSRYNTCATRVSYAINHSPVPFHKNPNSNNLKPDGCWKINGYCYYISVDNIIDSLKTIWGEPKSYGKDFDKSLQKEHSMDFYVSMTTKEENRKLFGILESFNKKGVVAMRLEGNRIRHSTLWDRNGFVDFKMNDKLDDDIKITYLYGYDYLRDPINNYSQHITDFYFWEIK
ncbi:T6SS effector amidase Tae4 family protein [Helicobacter sp. T3_23-1056]